MDSILDNTTLDYPTIRNWFGNVAANGYTHLDVPVAQAGKFASLLGLSIRRCYLSDQSLSTLLDGNDSSEQELIAACLPDRGSTMAGDFGELLAYVFHLADNGNLNLCGPKKWRLKDNRRKPSPMSDVVQFSLPNWPTASEHDLLFCSEVKIKSTRSKFRPITQALEHSRKDRASRLAKTLVWLRERTILGEDTDVDREQLDRFIKAAENPAFSKSFKAVAVVCNGLIQDELVTDPPVNDPHHRVVVIGIPELKETYQQVFEAVAVAGLPNEAVT
ncbi:Hachiman antiphage defense system protein HamA [Gimesia maris]|uniref:Hachiman antiphage defense system protein HamA n=1 Tax=Gimesia maris TaxID=122 RepID=UPI003A8E6E1B